MANHPKFSTREIAELTDLYGAFKIYVSAGNVPGFDRYLSEVDPGSTHDERQGLIDGFAKELAKESAGPSMDPDFDDSILTLVLDNGGTGEHVGNQQVWFLNEAEAKEIGDGVAPIELVETDGAGDNEGVRYPGQIYRVGVMALLRHAAKTHFFENHCSPPLPGEEG